jgi:hypothetical protein
MTVVIDRCSPHAASGDWYTAYAGIIGILLADFWTLTSTEKSPLGTRCALASQVGGDDWVELHLETPALRMMNNMSYFSHTCRPSDKHAVCLW